MLASPQERVCFDARRHGVVLARPLAQALVLAGAGAVLLLQTWPLQVPGAALVVAGSLLSLRAVWRWERSHLVVTTEKLFVVDGTLRRRSSSVRLRSVMSRQIREAPTTFPARSRIGETAAKTSTRLPSLRRRIAS